MRVLSLIVAIVMAISILPLAALAEEIDKKGQVGLVVYGAEITELVSLSGSLDSLKDMAEDAIAEGVSVPKVKVQLTNKATGRTYTLNENTEISLMETIDFQSEAYDWAKNEVEETYAAAIDNLAGIPVVGSTLVSMLGNLEEYLATAQETTASKVNSFLSQFENVANLNGKAYRIFTSEELPAGEYQVYVEEFDNDDDTIRDGYKLFDDKTSTFFTERTFDITVDEHEKEGQIQYIGNDQNGLGLDLTFGGLAGTFSENVQKIVREMESLGLSDRIPAFKKIFEVMSLDFSFKFAFPGLWTTTSKAGFEFTNVDYMETGIAGNQFLLINRQELIDVLKLMKDIGKEAFEGALKATFGGDMSYTYRDDVITYEGISDLYLQLVELEDGQLNLNYDTAYAIVNTYIHVLLDMKLFDWFVETDTSDALAPIKLKYPIPAILETTSDENGIVKFSRDENITLTWMLKIIPEVMTYISKVETENEFMNLLIKLNDYAAPFLEQAGDLAAEIINTMIYPFAQRLGLVGPKMASGKYLMFQTKVVDDYRINPIAYTMDISWVNVDWVYLTVADMGLIGPYFAEGFYDFVRKTTFAGTLDAVLGKIKQDDDYNVVSDILNGKINLTDKTNQALLGALTAFASEVGFDSLGGNMLFATKTDLIKDMNDYLLKTGMTAQNLVVYLNRLAMRSKTVYTGRVDDGWYFYNLDKSPTTTATKLINKSTNDIAKAMEIESQKTVVQKTGETVSKIVNKVGTKVEERANSVKQKVRQTVGAAVQKVVQSVVDSAKAKVKDFFTNLFNRS